MRKLFYLLVILITTLVQAQQPQKLNAAEIYKDIEKLNFLGSVLYIAAHPDDENTRLISYLSNEAHARTAYLSITRGDGGQNLIGAELGPLLGIIRTQELLAARKIDGGHQFFTRANDFGYSKHPDETLELWEKEEVLSDVVYTIRKFRPDVIINRFDHTTPGETHGHHTTSAILSVEAFDLAGEKTAFQKQLDPLEPWQPKKLFQNTSPWFYENQEAFDKEKSQFIELKTGVYFPLLGLSNSEIASLSRSQHQSQGFGSTGTRGEEQDYLKLLKGNHPSGATDLFAGINTTWSRLKGGEKIGKILKAVEEDFNFLDPSASIPGLLEAYELILQLEDEHWRKIKTQEITDILAACAGLYLEAVASQPTATRGEEIHITLEAINRSDIEMELAKVELSPSETTVTPHTQLLNNEGWSSEASIIVPEDASYSAPYWLRNPGSVGMYSVENPEFIGLPETPNTFSADFSLEINGTSISFEKPVVYKTNDPVLGEVYQPFEIIPPASVGIEQEVIIFSTSDPKRIPVTIKASRDTIAGSLKLQAPASWTVSPESHNFQLQHKGEERTYYFNVTPPHEQSEAYLIPVAEVQGEEFSKEIISIDYAHIPLQTVLLPSASKVVKLDIRKKGELIGYIHGAGDAVPESLEQIGYKVVTLNPETISAANLENFDAVVVGIRAYNTVDALSLKQNELLEYVRNGGNLIVQYNTSQRFQLPNLAPYPLSLSRGRVTDENSPVTFLAKQHEVLNTPNKITSEDFEGWVQERGLYFPQTWAPEFTPILSMNDPGEAPLEGSLLIAPYGKGNYIYTGLSFFRELPAGVPGAYRLFANLVSLGSPGANQTTPNHSN